MFNILFKNDEINQYFASVYVKDDGIINTSLTNFPFTDENKIKGILTNTCKKSGYPFFNSFIFSHHIECNLIDYIIRCA